MKIKESTQNHFELLLNEIENYKEKIKIPTNEDLLEIKNYDLAGFDLSSIKLSNIHFLACNFKGTLFGNLDQVIFDGVTLDDAKFKNSEGNNITFQSINAKNINLENAKFINPIFASVTFTKSNLKGAQIIEGTIDLSLKDTDASGFSIKNSFWKEGLIESTKLNKACFENLSLNILNISNSWLNGAILNIKEGKTLTITYTEAKEISFENSNFTCQFSLSDFTKSNFKNTNFNNSYLKNCNFQESDFTGYQSEKGTSYKSCIFTDVKGVSLECQKKKEEILFEPFLSCVIS
jgi:uncharacterized protein YjbI with pentapeptide repeats